MRALPLGGGVYGPSWTRILEKVPDFGKFAVMSAFYPNDCSAVFSALASNKRTRRETIDLLARYMRRNGTLVSNNIVIGAGLHAMVLATNLDGNTTVLDDDGPGGNFNKPSAPVYYLNSRNRPGSDVGKPGSGSALNYFPGARFQLSSLEGGEYQTNDDMAFGIIVNLALSGARCNPSYAALINFRSDNLLRVVDQYGTDRLGKRVFIATGPGVSTPFPGALSFDQFMKGFAAGAVPIRGAKQVAVIGAGDSGKVVVEALLGLGPTAYPTSIMYADKIDWYGQDCEDCEDFISANRVRYHQIAQSFPRYADSGDACYSRITARPKAVGVAESAVFTRGLSGARRFGGKYDLIVDCRGPKSESLSKWYDGPIQYVYNDKGVPIAQKAVGEEIYFVGPCAQLPASVKETVGIPENTIAAWRYTAKTAYLARSLG